MATKPKKTASCKSSRKKGKRVEKKTPPPSPTPARDDDDDDDDGSPSPVRAIACLKMVDDMKRFEETDDCFILGFDPYEPAPMSQLPLDLNAPPPPLLVDAVDLSVIAEKGQVACRDYPHSRHLCLKFPFKTTPHETHCELCYCYVCDLAAPCQYWTLDSHCNAENAGFWKAQREVMRKCRI